MHKLLLRLDDEYPGICCERHAPPDLVARYRRATRRCSSCKRRMGPRPPFFIPPATYEQPARYTAPDGSRVHGSFTIAPDRLPVFHVVYRGLHQPHHRLFVQTDAADGGGIFFEVTGAIEHGMQYKEMEAEKPEKAAGHESLCSKIILGSVAPEHLRRFRELCSSNPFGIRKRIDSVARWGTHPRSQFWISDIIGRAVAAKILELVER